MPSILTGVYSWVHQINDSTLISLNPNIKTLPELLAVNNYQTAIFSTNYAAKHLDVNNKFQELFIETGSSAYKPIITEYFLTSQIQSWLEKKGKINPFFLYIHYWGCHAPYRPPASYRGKFSRERYRKEYKAVPISTLNAEDKVFDGKGRIPYALAENNITDMHYYISQYDGVIAYVDSQVGRLMNTLKRLKLNNDTMIILTSDHGEMLGEHDMYFYHNGGYEENIKVPLIIRLPGMFPKGKKVSAQVSLIDIAPTILEITGSNKPSYMQGESLLSFVKPLRSYNANYVFSCDRNIISVRRGNWKLIYNSINHSCELFDLKNDPKVKNNLMYQRKDMVKILSRRMAEWKDKKNYSDLKGNQLLPEKDKVILRSLGYLN